LDGPRSYQAGCASLVFPLCFFSSAFFPCSMSGTPFWLFGCYEACICSFRPLFLFFSFFFFLFLLKKTKYNPVPPIYWKGTTWCGLVERVYAALTKPLC
jgi:hypothetical protein